MRRAIVFAGILLAGCVSAEEPVVGPGGQTVQQTKCSGSPTACLKTANKTCGGTYQVLDSSSNAGGVIADVMPGPVTWYKMTYQCGRTDGRMPTFPFRGSSYIPPRMSTTTCNGFGNTVTCNSY